MVIILKKILIAYNTYILIVFQTNHNTQILIFGSWGDKNLRLLIVYLVYQWQVVPLQLIANCD